MAFFPDVPTGDWAEFNSHLTYEFYELQIPMVPVEEWQTVADVVAGDSTFASFGMASGDTYTDWKDWAFQLVTALNGGN